MDGHLSPIVVPLGACVVGIVAIIVGVAGGGYKQKLRADQLQAMLARGMSAVEIEKLLTTEARTTRDPLQRVAGTRRIAIVLISSAVGIMLFFLVLAGIVKEQQVLSGAAIGLIPLSIGVGFLIDYKLQKRELSRFGLDMGRVE